jgi:hypothetical protein
MFSVAIHISWHQPMKVKEMLEAIDPERPEVNFIISINYPKIGT